MRLGPRRIALAAALATLAVGGAWLWREAHRSGPVSEAEALARFRAGPGTGGRPGIPAPGVYTYAQRGSERAGAGPLGVRRDLPDRARYVVRAVRGGYEEELGLSEDHVEAVRYRVAVEGTRAVWRRTDVRVVGIGRDDRRDLRPPPLRLPSRLAVGRAWAGRYSAGELTVRFRSRVVRREAVGVGGEAVPAVLVRTEADTSGPHPGTRVDEVWWSPERRLALRWRIGMDIGGPFTLETEADLRIESFTPAR